MPDPVSPVDSPALDLEAVNDNGPVHAWDCDRFEVYNYGTRQGTCDCTAERDRRALVAEVERLRQEMIRRDDARRDSLCEIERLRAELADHHCDCLAGKIAEVRADRDRLAAQVERVEGVAAWYEREARLSESSLVAGFYRAAADNVRAALAIPATEETEL